MPDPKKKPEPIDPIVPYIPLLIPPPTPAAPTGIRSSGTPRAEALHFLYKFRMAAFGEHCALCSFYDGQVKTYLEWQTLEAVPPIHPSCRCSLDPIMETFMPDANPDPQSETFEQHATFEAAGSVTPTGAFEILAITAGTGNGWEFPEACLKASVALWNNTECFVDHDLASHSIRDLVGVCHSPTWDEQAKGVKLQLKAAGPAGPVLVELGKWMLSDATPLPKVGFSADVIFSAIGKKVQTILKVLSVDLVFNPARGGAFLRALNNTSSIRANSASSIGANSASPGVANSQPQKEPNPMPEKIPTSTEAQLAADQAAMRSLLDEQSRIDALNAQAESAREARAQMCAYLLDAGLSASKLPAPSQAAVRKVFAGKIFEAPELQAAIDDARSLVSDLTAGLVVQGPGRIHSVFDTSDKLQAAMDDLMGAPRDPGSEKLQIVRPFGIRELYLSLTGDYDMHGGYYPERASLATTADFTGLVKNAMNKVIVDRWGELGRAGYDWWTKVAVVEHFNTLNSITGVLVGTVGTLPTVAEGGEYTELAVGDSPETATFVKYGGYIPLTLELIDRDNLAKLKAYPRELASAAIRKISSLVAAIFSASAGAGPTMADTGALFNATALATKGGHLNLLTTGLSPAQWEVVSAAIYNQPMLVKQDTGYYGTGPKMALPPRYLLVPRALQLTGRRVLYPDHEYTATYFAENMQQGQPGDVLTVPDWTDADDWAAVVDPTLAPSIYVGERFGILPEIFIAGDSLSPAVFSNDETRLKVRQFAAVWVNDFRPLANNHVN